MEEFARMVTNELIESPLSLLSCDVEDHIAREDRVGNVEHLTLKAANGGTIPAHVHHNAFHSLHRTQEHMK